MPTLPDATTTLTATAAWSQPVFNGLLPYAELAIGLIIAVGIVGFLIFAVARAFNH